MEWGKLGGLRKDVLPESSLKTMKRHEPTREQHMRRPGSLEHSRVEAGEGGLMERRSDTADGQVQGTRVQLPPPVLERRARKP